jgi:hypothetical protein
MPARHRLEVNFFLTRRKVFSAKSFYILLAGLAALIVYVWVKDSYRLSLQFFLFLFPHLFLFISQDMMMDEIETGVLENIAFVRGAFRNYLFEKNIYLFLMALVLALTAFSFFAAYGLASGEFSARFLLQFLMGVAAGAYYISLGGFLSFYFKGGSNVLVVIIGQLAAFIGLLFSAAQRSGFIDQLTAASFPDWSSRFKFIVFLGVWPNILASDKYFAASFGIAALACFFLMLQRMKLGALELKKR